MMRLVFVMLFLMLTIMQTFAQEQPKTVTTVKIQQPSLMDTALYKIEQDGEVKIDWDAVEALASTKSDRTLSFFAEVMLAIRDKTWKPMHQTP